MYLKAEKIDAPGQEICFCHNPIAITEVAYCRMGFKLFEN